MLAVYAFRFDHFNENTYLVADASGACAIVDPGCSTEEERGQLIGAVEAFALKPTMLWNTHCHIDHIFGNQYLAEYFGIPLYLHKQEWPTLKAMPRYAATRGFTVAPFDGETRFLADSDTVRLGRSSFEVRHTPGHSVGSIAFYHAAQGFVISGDTLFCGKIGRVNLPGGHYDTLVATIKGKLFTLPDGCVVYPGHGVSTTIGHEKQHNRLVCW